MLYVLRTDSSVPAAHIDGDVGPEGTFKSWDDYLIACTTHKGNDFIVDNNTVYNTIQSLLQVKKGDAADTEIKRFHNDMAVVHTSIYERWGMLKLISNRC